MNPPDHGLAAPLALTPATPAKAAPPPRPEAAPRAPEDLSLLVRVNDPEQLAREVVSILPPSAAAAAAALDPTQLLTLLLGRRLAGVVDVTQSIDLASVGGKDSQLVVSMAVKQESEGKLTEGLVLREEGGLLHIITSKSDESASGSDKLSACAFTAAAGRAPTRLVCASDERALTATAAYLARNVAAEPFDSDARLTVPGRVLREKRDSTARAVGEAASHALGAALVEGFLGEIDRIDADLRFAGGGLEIGLDLRLSGRESLLGRVLVPRSRSGPPPPAFYRLPADSIVALHTTGALAEDIAPLRKTLADTVEGTLIKDGYGAEKTHALRERIETLVLTGGPLVVAAGIAGGRDGADKALAALDGAHSSPADALRTENQARSALMPWLMMEVEEPASTWTQGLRDVVRRAEDADRTRAPGSKASTPRDPSGDHIDLRIGTLDPALKLPKDSLHLEVLIAPRTKGTRPTRKAHLFVVPKGNATWIGYCEDSTAIVARLRLALDDTSETGTLARSTEATSLKTPPAIGAGLVVFSGLAHLAATTTTSEELRAAGRSVARSAGSGAPHGTQTITWTASADTAPGTVHLAVRAQATRQMSTDLLRTLGL
jgi:hypothetical protein